MGAGTVKWFSYDKGFSFITPDISERSSWVASGAS